ncbi:MAG: DUF2956 domain-containing protein [Pseudomonadota bacterium]
MSKYKQTPQPSAETYDIAMSIAKGIQKPNQTKEQTKLIAQGIQKGVAEYKKQQKGKVRELNKLKKKITHQQTNTMAVEIPNHEQVKCKHQWLPWFLLAMSWIFMAVFITF